MRRRSRSPKDSLDLLLDTMCNAFGGIVLIAILVALLIEKPGDGELPETPMTRENLTLLRKAAELSRLEKEIKEAEELHDKNRQLIDLIVKRNQLVKALEMRRESDALPIVELNEMLGRFLEEKSTLLSRVSELTSEKATVETMLSQQQVTLSRLDAEMKELITSRMSETRPPELRDASGKQYNIIVKHGQIFPLADLKFNGAGELYGISMNDYSLNWKGDIATPIKDKGRDLASDRASLETMFSEISRYNGLFPSRPSERFYIIFFVYQDSFDLITPLREMVKSAGSIQDGWEPKVSGEILAFSNDGEKSQTD